ncbi:hypothetical protein HYS97_00955 [Candidatus Daviesbacteria bacterium]|nr:hypothetical protein [Candidatus Daviesbacteria bacterium]
MNIFDKLPNILSPFVKKSQTEEYYFALNIDSSKRVDAAVWAISGDRIRIIHSSFASYKHEEQLIEASNIALDEALADFQPEPAKVLFGVPDSWLQDEELKPEKLKTLRQMVKELDISPLAYVSTTQAISHYMNKDQGVPLTAILVKITDPLSVTVVKGGKVVESRDQKRTDNLPQDIEKALMSITDVEVLPSRFLIYGTEKEGKFKDEIQAFPWMNQLPFLHLPKIEILPDEIEIQAICLAGASELHPDTNFNTKDLIAPSKPELKHHAKALPQATAEELGFVQGEIEDEEKRHHAKDEYDAGLEDGFDEEKEDEHFGRRRETHHPAVFHEGHTELALASPLDRFKALVAAPLSLIKKPRIGIEHHGGKSPIFLKAGKILILPVIILLFLVAAFLFLPKAKVSVFIDLRVLEKDSQIVADPKISQIDEANKIIPGKTAKTEQVDTGKGSATGKKKVGEEAKGKVIVYNKTSSLKTISQGTVLTGPNNLKFALDTSVQIASQSSSVGADFTTIVKPGKSDPVGATATEIGPEGNIAAGTELSVSGSSSDQVVAKVDTAFSGGVSKDVTVVTSDDQKKLLAQVTSDLRKKAQEDIQGKLEPGFKVLAEGLSEEVVKKTYSKNVNDQASEFSLSLTARYSGTAYSENDLKTIVSKLVETNVPEGYKLDLTRTETQADVSKIEKDGRLIFLAKFKAKLMPKLDEAQIKKDIAGKSPIQAADRLKKIENVIGSSFEITPSLPFKPLQILPILPQNISIEVTAK